MNEQTRNLMFSSKSDDWETPKEIYGSFMLDGYVDPCPFKSEVDNLDVDFGDVKMFINPPYSDINSWVEFAVKHHKNYKNKIVLLVPSRTDTKWFHRFLDYGVDLKFVKGRIKFSGLDRAPFPSVYITLKGK